MSDVRAQLETPLLIIGDGEGDGPVLSLVPPPFKGILRNTFNKMEGQRQDRLMRVVGEIYPILQRIEAKALPEGERRLAGVSLTTAMRKDECIERALRIFVSAWNSNVFRLIDTTGKQVTPDKGRSFMGACGLTIEQAQMYFIDRAVKSIFRKNPKALKRLVGVIRSPDALPRLRVLSQFQQLAMTELIQGFGTSIGQALVEIDPDVLYAMATLKAYHLRALRQVLRSGFKNIAAWQPDTIRALGVHFTCVEQIRDIGEAFGSITDPEAITVLGKWEIRDITDKVNEERASRGEPKVSGHKFETDLGLADKIFGSWFTAMLGMPPDILEGLGNVVKDIRTTDKVDRKDKIDRIQLFCDRYLEMLPLDVLRALGIVGKTPSTFGEALYICEGLFTKPGLGRKFFEGPLQTPEGIKALTALKEQVGDMRKNGSIKSEAEIQQLIQNSDMLDGPVAQYITFR
ncbi:hypothetical protein HEQ60_08650 [Haematospirillum sp. H1815]|uniref:hypothetical protein n=1 Tax=Haematospirillum sp. H1815 TaxID=2723108 RepID=UPI00143B7031|nr:hypothetical protein [Haematospirillum sp. H1815]NKD77828.1 hypothetical protein [Haematospirillum sp. H1815]